MISLRCLRCGLSFPLEGSRGEFCPRCLARLSDRRCSWSRSTTGLPPLQEGGPPGW